MHDAYAPVGYTYAADNWCLDCIPTVLVGADKIHFYVTDDGCNCTEHLLDRIADDTKQGKTPINREDERSFDSGDFPKSIPYHNDLHVECGPQYYGYGPDDPEWEQQYCSATCAKCHAVIDGVSTLDGDDECPAFANRDDADTNPAEYSAPWAGEMR